MSPNNTFRPTLSLSIDQATAFLPLASRHIPRAEQLDTARDLGLSTTPAVDENGFSETALALWQSMNQAEAAMTMASLTPTQPTRRNLRIWLGRPYATVARTQGEKIHVYRIDTEEIPHVVAANSPLGPRPETFDGPPYLPTEFLDAAEEGNLDTAQAILEHLTTFGPADSLFPPRLGQRRLGVRHVDPRQHHPRRRDPLGRPQRPVHTRGLLPGHPATRRRFLRRGSHHGAHPSNRPMGPTRPTLHPQPGDTQMSNITWDHFEVQRAATDAAYASFALNGVSLSSPATGSKAQATLNEKMQGLKQAIEDMSEAANAMSAGLKAADKAFEDNEQQCKVKITKSARFLDNSMKGWG